MSCYTNPLSPSSAQILSSGLILKPLPKESLPCFTNNEKNIVLIVNENLELEVKYIAPKTFVEVDIYDDDDDDDD